MGVLVRGLFLLCSLSWPVLASAQLLKGESAGQVFTVEEVARGLGVPWGMAFIAPNRLLFTEREGRVRLLALESGGVTEISGLPAVRVAGQGGLLDVRVEPGYKPGGWIYFSFVKDVNRQGATALGRARLKGARLVDWQTLLVTDARSDTGRHFGGRIAFDDAGHLFLSVGERGVRPNAQNLGNMAGTVLRLNLDGTLPSDNPFVGQADVKPQIWSYGHRNPQGLAWDHVHQRLWESEHGPRGGDEINLIVRGANYGWPVLSYGKEYWGPVAVGEGTQREGMESPRKVYVPSIAPGSLLYYTGEAFPAWRGDLFLGALALTHLNRVTVDDAGRAIGEERLLGGLHERIRALVQSPEGWLYLSTDSGRILRLRPAD